MSGMRIMPESVQKEHVETCQFSHAFGRNGAVVGQVSAIAETEAVDSPLPVFGGYRFDRKASDRNGFVRKYVDFDARPTGFVRPFIEDVAESALDSLERIGRGVDWNLASLYEIERTNVIEPQDVIGVGVRVENGVQTLDTGAQGLVAEIGRR